MQRLLDQDKVRRDEWYRGYSAVFRGKTPRRRLAFVNALLLALQRIGGDGKLDDYARDLEVTDGRRSIRCSLLTRFRKPKKGAERKEVLEFEIRSRSWHGRRHQWADDRTGPIEDSLREICCSLVLIAELESREQRMEDYRYRLTLFEDELKRAEQRRREVHEGAHQRLVAQVRAHREAEDIRQFVALARRLKGTESLEFAGWQRWALGRADAIDPLAGGQFDSSLPTGDVDGGLGWRTA